MTKENDLRAADSLDEGEPLTFFQDLPRIDLGADDLADMKRSVHELIHARAVEAAIEEGHGGVPSVSRRRTDGMRARIRPFSRWLRTVSSSAGLRVAAAFAAVVLTTSLLVPSFAPEPLQVAQAPLVASTPSSADLAAALAEIESLPLVENLGSDAELIQIEDDEMSLVVAAIQ